MLEFFKKNAPTQLNNETPDTAKKELSRIRKRISLQAYLAVMTVVLTVVIVLGMTAAWYTNVVQTGGLIFEVAQSGVNVDATIQSGTITFQPGDHGVIGLEATNKDTVPVDITVTISKSGMDTPMQQRLYFYVESQKTAHGETSDRTYVTASTGYTYQVFGGKDLTLTEQYHNASALKWCWVYDVLGYYVLGQAQGDDVVVQEYLRPIEYDYDLATFDAAGELLTVDGMTTVERFLAELSQEDGYPGQISMEQKTGRYYQVSVDARGFGVYAYLCTRGEVEANTDYDTALGAAANKGETIAYTAVMTVNAEPTVLNSVTVDSTQALLDALAGEYDTVVLNSDLILDAGTKITVPGDQTLILDLNGHTLTTDTAGYAVTLEPNAALTVTNGTLSGNNAGNAFTAVGADLTLNDVTLLGYERGIHVSDHTSKGNDSTIRISGCVMELDECGVLLYGNGSESQQTTKLLIENSQITSQQFTISGNGTITGTGRWGTEIEIVNSQLVQDTSRGEVYSAIYHPQRYGTMNIYNSTISGYTGMAIKGGTVIITDSQVLGVGDQPAEPTLTTSGYADTADAIYVEAGYGYDIAVTIRNTTATSEYAMGLRVYEENSPFVDLILEGTNQFYDRTKVSETP